jgi:hypothetical protein
MLFQSAINCLCAFLKFEHWDKNIQKNSFCVIGCQDNTIKVVLNCTEICSSVSVGSPVTALCIYRNSNTSFFAENKSIELLYGCENGDVGFVVVDAKTGEINIINNIKDNSDGVKFI